MQQTQKIVTVFGGWKAQPSDLIYKQAVELGEFLSLNNFIVRSGGQGGIMDGISEGAYDGNQKRVQNKLPEVPIQGILITDYWNFHSKHLTVKQDFTNTGERTEKLCQQSEIFIVFPGQKGTFLELLYLLNSKDICLSEKKPQIDYGNKDILVFQDPWYKILEQSFEQLNINKKQLEYFIFVDSVQDIKNYIQKKYNLKQ
eukprot:TRINITY_DN20000_c0_g1_i1.p1 TRINITY_DN20000_c0_g1~~TRINITY_DN20000_c0_g1_i1.p1  ORF type:complete len:200 (+),score=17.72 TRINITY_DN20000_c0_g1_i1:139-738(+)